MKDINILTLTLLLFLWLGTVLWFFIYWRRHRTRPVPAATTDFFLTLASEKAREARAAQEQLYKTADLLRVGLLMLKDTGLEGLNAFGRELAQVLNEDTQALSQLGALKEDSHAITLKLKSVVLQCTLLKQEDGASEISKRVIVAQDVTQSFELARELQYRERLAILGKMTGQIAHQLKTPLAVLAGRAQLLAAKGQDFSLPNAMREQLLLLYEEARSLAQRINDILDLYRTRNITIQPVSVPRLFEAVQERLLELEHECEVLVECPADMTVQGDRAGLEMALFLLGQNAVSSGVGAQHIYLRAVKTNGHVVLELEDDGKGISPDLQARLFEPFVSGRTEGLGLGLFLAKDLIERMNGELKLAFTSPKGTCFQVRL